MSLIEELGAQLHAAADELPLGLVTAATERLRVGMELLQWVRQESVHEVGVGQLANATEQLEAAALALRGAQDSLAAYLAALGLPYDAAPTPDASWRRGLRPPAPPPSTSDTQPDATPLGRWWTERVDQVTDHGTAGEPVDERGAATDPADLLRRVARPVRAGDRERLRAELRRVGAPVGLGLSAITPPVARHLATDLLGHEPAAADLPELTKRTQEPVRALLPGVPDELLPALLARVCRVPPPDGGSDRPPPHPADPAVTWAVLVGVLLHRLGRDPDSLRDAEQPDG
jgi:hypothetical protein